jgi:hypothetical protein
MFALFSSERIWRTLAHFWMAGMIGAGELDLLMGGPLRGALDAMAIIYVAVLSMYAGTKEFSRWHEMYKSGHHPGELMVGIWTIFMGALFFEKAFFRQDYYIPAGVVSAYIAVLSIFAITTRSKSEHEKRKRGGGGQNKNFQQ